MSCRRVNRLVSMCMCACMCRNEAKVLMKAQGSSAVGFKIITSIHKGNSSVCVCVCVCFGCKGLHHSSVNLNLSFLDVFSLNFSLSLECMLHLVHHLSTWIPCLLIHSLSLSSLIQLLLSHSFYTSPQSLL